MHLLYSTEQLKVSGFNIQATNVNDIDEVVCNEERTEVWKLELINPVGYDGIHRQSSFYSDGKGLILLLRIYEHSRGGSIHYFINAITMDGKVRWAQAIDPIYIMSIILENENKCWVINSFPTKRIPEEGKIYLGQDLVEINLHSGNEMRRIKLFGDASNMNSQSTILYPFRVSLEEDERDILIRVDNWNYQEGDPYKEHVIPLKSLL